MSPKNDNLIDTVTIFSTTTPTSHSKLDEKVLGSNDICNSNKQIHLLKKKDKFILAVPKKKTFNSPSNEFKNSTNQNNSYMCYEKTFIVWLAHTHVNNYTDKVIKRPEENKRSLKTVTVQ